MSNLAQAEINPKSIPKLVQIIARLNVGGGAQLVCMLHERLRFDYETFLIAGSLAEGERDMSYLLSSEQNLLRLPQMSREISLVSDAVTFWRIYHFLRTVRPAIVHTHSAKAGALGRFAARLAGIPVIVHTYHGHVFHSYFGPFKTRLFLAVERFLGRISTKIVAISESQFQELALTYRVAPAEKIAVIHNGFDLEGLSRKNREQARCSLGLKAEHYAVVWAGRMAPVKDVELLGAVIRKASQHGRHLRFLVVGDGTERAKLESAIEGCANVELLGWRDDIPTIWSAADVALLTSRNEGTPTALIEAMAAGVPFVATNVGAVQDMALGPLRPLPNDAGFQARNGFLTQRTPEALLSCLELLAADANMSGQMAAAGRAFVVDRFSSSRLIADLSSLYSALLHQTGQISGTVKSSAQSCSNVEDVI